MAKSISPITWPGGKSKKWDLIKSFFPSNTSEMYYHEPFFGGGSVGLNSLNEGLFKKYYFNDKNSELMCFWTNISKVNLNEYSFYPNINLKNLDLICRLSEKYIQFLINNNLGFNGLPKSTWTQKRLQQNWNINKFERIQKCALCIYQNRDKIKFSNWDCFFFYDKIKEYEHKKFWYLDPPYFDVETKIYKYNDINSSDLLCLVTNIDRDGGKFLLSINNSDNIKKKFKKFNIVEREWKYTMTNNSKQKACKLGKELFIKNY
ncbi:DNA adenine methylase [Spiroplasma endosymbiont of Aspidapion aeneum]|uniref:DNA adenine methylase n=1 Tax=Spiroplasma endosymbiont of Aspidapion aeneum TaxID=3066276 RepID=UPI00313F0B49